MDGKVEEGMTPDMVLMAIGKPTEVSTRGGTPQTGEDEIWIYRTGGETMDPGMMYPGAGYPGTYPGGYPGGYPAGYPSGGYPGGYPGSYPGSYPGGTGGGIVMSPGRGVAVIPPSVGIGIGGGGIGIGGGGLGGGMGGMGMPMPVSRRPVEEREVVFRNGVVYRADPPPENK